MSTSANRTLLSRFQQVQWAFQGLAIIAQPPPM
jgi:hypothetical protein